MTTMPAAQTMTAREYLELPPHETAGPWSLVDGELVVTEATALHQRLALRLAFAFEEWIRSGTRRGTVSLPIDIAIDDRNVYAADVSWYPEGRDPATEGERPYSMPGLAVEVRSPSTWRYDIGAKKSGYERTGLPELWLVDTDAREVLVFRRSSASAPSFDVSLQLSTDDVLESPLLPGFALPLERLFG